MPQSVLTHSRFHDEQAALAFVEAKLWPNGPVCPHCRGTERIGKLNGKTTRLGLYKCYGCRRPFTVRMGTIFEDSHLPLHLWLQAIHLLCASKKGISSHQLSRVLGTTIRTAWFLSHRIREAMSPLGRPPMGGSGKIIEADETEIAPSRKTKAPNRSKRAQNMRFVALVERGGEVRSKVITERGMQEVRAAVRQNVEDGSMLHTDGAKAYMGLMPLGQHEAVEHKNTFARDGKSDRVHTNTAEGYFSLFKRGLVGTYQQMSHRHLHRYLAEFDFRMNHRIKLGYDDTQRAERALLGMIGKRLTWQKTGENVSL